MEVTVDVLREQTLEKIRDDVKKAYDNRVAENLIPEIKNTHEALEKAKKSKSWFVGLSDDGFVDLGAYVEHPNRATVSNPHDYKALLTQALIQLSKDGYYRKSDITQTVEDILEHEFEHHVPALGNDGLEIRYCIEFLEDTKKRYRGFRPIINFSGNMQVGVYKDVVGAVKEKSATDKILL
jgi:hypothetical protein